MVETLPQTSPLSTETTTETVLLVGNDKTRICKGRRLPSALYRKICCFLAFAVYFSTVVLMRALYPPRRPCPPPLEDNRSQAFNQTSETQCGHPLLHEDELAPDHTWVAVTRVATGAHGS